MQKVLLSPAGDAFSELCGPRAHLLLIIGLEYKTTRMTSNLSREHGKKKKHINQQNKRKQKIYKLTLSFGEGFIKNSYGTFIFIPNTELLLRPINWLICDYLDYYLHHISGLIFSV